ncbi:hypothetical protein SRB5_22710 [Streptomyces sp. RB5]|uniref:Mycothiol-dependent maleylpyruvate isomerase metal-binding domain-containing protein n=1 Tax=Streptomyces smaragdinus TaxID=2585196 RepID=A0A7K0CF91_9ACTN|nr:maleylpyruvate isomerase N-terminal domain-containing protein [Streptomyces smaragdinus]MQY12141.1 hypothetical protein [Streptomyces smaragdinus]
MTGEHDAVRELLGAWALDALLPGEEERVLGHLAGCALCAGEAESLREVAGVLGAAPLSAPASPSAGGVLAAALRRRPAAGSGTAAHAAPYAAVTAGLDALLREVDARGVWRTPVRYGWDVQGMVAHLLAADEPLRLAVGGEAPVSSSWREDWEARTASVVAYESGFAPAETWGRWREQVRGLLESAPGRDAGAAARAVTLLGMPLPLAEHFVVRAFECWIHTDDIGQAVGLPVPPPPDAHLRTLTELGLRLLTAAFAGNPAPVRLTVAGHAPTVLGASEGAVRADVAMDPVGFCLLIGDRVTPGRVSWTASGDEAVAADVLRQAQTLAWL